jgi:hypothetical protein
MPLPDPLAHAGDLRWQAYLLFCAAVSGVSGCDLPSSHLAATRWVGSDGAASDVAREAASDVVSDAAQEPDASIPVGCVESRIDLTRPTGTVVLVLERSNAMNALNDSTCASCGSYFTALEQAVESLTTATSNRFRWGLKLFPSPADTTGCLVTPALDLSPMQDPHAAVAAALAMTPPNGGAPVTAAVRATSSYLSGLSDNDPKLMVLATAGAPTCASNDPTGDDLSAAVAAVDAAPQFTFVLGLGPQRARFGKLADVGATVSAYSVDQAALLLRDIENLAGELATCVYPIPDGPLGDRSVAVLLDGTALTPGGTDGFSVSSDGARVRLLGSACFYLASHTSLAIRVGCGV